MPQFILRAMDCTDEDAINRRMAARGFHLERMKEEKSKNVFIMGGAILNNANKMIGSVIVLTLPNEQSVNNWIQEDPYIKHKVWDDISIFPFRIADV